MARLSLANLVNLATLSSLVLARLSLANLANLATFSSLTILVSLANSPAAVVGLKIEASTESFTDGFDEVENGELLVPEGWFLYKLFIMAFYFRRQKVSHYNIFMIYFH